MTTPQGIARVAPRFRIRPTTLMTAIGVLVAITVSIVILALTDAHHTTASTPVTPSQAAGGTVPQIHYMGPRQARAGLNSQTAHVHSDATAPAAGASYRALQYSCLWEKLCIQVR
jgi:hypothetical protein